MSLAEYRLKCHLQLQRGNLDEVLLRTKPGTQGNKYPSALRGAPIRRILATPGLNDSRRAELDKDLKEIGSGESDEPLFSDLKG